MSNKNDIASLSHSKWRCQYHIVFAPKYRRQNIYGQIRVDIGKILRKLCEAKGVEIIEAELCPDHIHMLVSIPPSISVSAFVGYLKGKSALMIFDKHANLKYRYGNRHFCSRFVLQKPIQLILSRDDEQDGMSGSIKNQELICKGWFLPPNTYDCGSFVVN